MINLMNNKYRTAELWGMDVEEYVNARFEEGYKLVSITAGAEKWLVVMERDDVLSKSLQGAAVKHAHE